MPELKIIVLSVQPTYASCIVNDRKHIERFTEPMTKEQVRVRIFERFKTNADPATVTSEPVDASVSIDSATSESKSETDSKSNKKKW